MRARWGSAALLVAVGVLGPGPHAAAEECIKLDVWVTWSGGGSTYVTPWPGGSCVVPTPGMTPLTAPEGGHREEWIPSQPSVPDGARFKGAITSP